MPPELNITVTAETLDGLAVAELAESPPGDADLCNVDLPNDSVLSRYIWTVDTFARNGAPCSATQAPKALTHHHLFLPLWSRSLQPMADTALCPCRLLHCCGSPVPPRHSGQGMPLMLLTSSSFRQGQ